jgi:hypothetical protein
MKETKESLLAKWCSKQGLFSKADLHRYGYENQYIRAWRTVCEFVVDGRAKKLTDEECKTNNLTTTMAWYAWVSDEPIADEHSAMVSAVNGHAEKKINTEYLVRDKQLAFIV